MKRAFLIGLAASGVAASVMLILRIVTGGLTLPEVLVDAVTRIIPLHLFSIAVNTLGPWAKRLLVIGLAIILFLLGGLVSMAWQWFTSRSSTRRDSTGWLAASILGLVLWLLAMVVLLPASRRGVFALSVSPWPAALVFSWLASAIVFSVTLALLASRTEPLTEYHAAAPATSPDESSNLSRRNFVKKLGWTIAGIAIASAAGVAIWKIISRIPAKLHSLSGENITPEITPNPDFYDVSIDFVAPRVDAATWKLNIDGLVETPLALDYEQLKSLPSIDQYQTLECISNSVGGDLISNALWKGVRLPDLLARTGIKPTAKKVVLHAADGYTDSITVAKAMETGTVLAYEMNGVTLPAEHGYPARLLVPNIYGMKNVKWLNHIELVDYDYKGYWEKEGWSDTAEILTMSRIDVPAKPDTYALPQDALLGGIAFAGSRGISWVELSVDGGKTWNRAQIKQPLSQFTWVLWTYDWKPPQEGTYKLAVRAADGTGAAQSKATSDPLPNGATGYDEVTVRLLNEPA